VAILAVIILLLILLDSNIGPNVTRFLVLGTALEWLGWIGILLSAFTIRKVLTAEPLPKENGKLSSNGLYEYVRYPTYTSVLLLCLGIAILSGSLIKYSLVVCLIILFHFKSVYEEKYLLIKYPEYR
jgi:protein-S-isoprenylcysteine O-methyltransferase Ste14